MTLPTRGYVLRTMLAVLACVFFGAPATAQTAQNVAVVINIASADSQRVGEYYVRQRGIPAANVIRIRTADAEAVTREVFAATIEGPIAAALTRERLHDRVLYIVLTKGVPLRIDGTAGQDGTVSSVDSELTLLYRRMSGVNVPVRGRIDNPYFLGTRPVEQAQSFTHRTHDIFLVTRLDAFTVEEAIALVDKAGKPAREGRFVLDQRSSLSDVLNSAADNWLEGAGTRLNALGQGDRVVLESTPLVARDITPVMGYYSWGSNDPRHRARDLNLGFVPGSIAATFVSSDARTFKEPPAKWLPSDSADTSTWFGGSPQSLIGDLIRQGATGVAGHVAEPYLVSTIRPNILFPAYVSGLNLVEAFYLAMPHLSWQTVVIGDPLCAPFPRRGLSAEEADGGIDAATELPSFFAKRRLAAAVAGAPKTARPAVELMVKAEGQLARGDMPGARTSFEEATKLAPEAAGAQLQLAFILETVGESNLAIERYKRVLAVNPNQPQALNNLAYAMATRQKSPAEALPLAKRAVAAAPRDGTILDTLAWIEHLLGQHKEAALHIAQAIKLAPNLAEIRLHAAVINAQGGARAVAETELQEALRLDPTLEKRPEVRDVRAALSKSSR